MCDAQRVFMLAEPLHPAARQPCAACCWPYGAALVYSEHTGLFVFCDACAELLAVQTMLLCRAATALGYREAWTYTLPDEPGTSLRAAGFEDMGMTRAEEHDRPNQPNRRRRPAEQPSAKRRWRRILVTSDAWELTG